MLALTVPNGTPDAIKPLLLEGSGPPFPVTVSDIGTPLTTLVPLTRELYVDAGTPATIAQQNGSIAFPFATIQQGVDALSLIGGGALLIAPGSYAESVVAGSTGVSIDFVNLGGTVGAIVTITSIALNGSPIGLIGVSVGAISIVTTAAVRMDRAVVTGNVACQALTLISSTIVGTLACTSITANNSNVNGVISATGVLLLKDCVFAAAVTTTAASGTNRLDDCRFSSTYTSNGAGQVTIARGCLVGLAFSASIVDIANCTLSSSLTTSVNATVRFTSIGGNCTIGGAATFYQARLSNITSVTGALVTDFASIAGVLPVLTYGSISVQDTTPRITINVPVPLIAAGAVAYVDAALAATDLVGMATATSMAVANATADLVAPGPGGGLLNVRFTAANTVRFAFIGPLAAQPAATFVLGFV